MKFKIALVLLAATTLFLGSCKKYPEGPGFSLRSKTNRLVGVWAPEKMFENGVALTLTADDLDDTWEYQKDGKMIYTDPGNDTTTGNWVFNKDKTKIVITISDSGLSFSITFEILKLTNDELWVKYSDGTDSYEDHYKLK